jgi:2-C-methyl-D-erythritol 4-phosphate cytidylyltransferase
LRLLPHPIHSVGRRGGSRLLFEGNFEKYQVQKNIQINTGGKERKDSVINGLKALASDTEIVVIHDGVRPFVTREMVEESIRGARRFGAVVLAMPVKETVKMANTDGTVLKTLERNHSGRFRRRKLSRQR